MTAQSDIGPAIPADRLTDEVREALARLAEENALLRASLAETRGRLSELELASGSDPLTELPDRRQFLRQLGRVVGQTERHGTPAALLVIDLKGLEAINRDHGRLAGDAALGHAARLIRGLIRASDLLARTGGSAFALLLDHLDPDSAVETGERIARCLAADPLELGAASVRLATTVAVAAILPGDKPQDVLDRAERNLARLKEF